MFIFVGRRGEWESKNREQFFNLQVTVNKQRYVTDSTSTAFQLTVDHAFTGSYATRFRPSDPPETLTCPCGSRTCDPSHIILDCPLFHEARALTKIVTPSHSLTLRQLLTESKFVPRLLQFLDITRAAARPPVFSTHEGTDLEPAEGIG